MWHNKDRYLVLLLNEKVVTCLWKSVLDIDKCIYICSQVLFYYVYWICI